MEFLFRFDVVLAHLVEGKICEVHVQALHVLWIRSTVVLCAEASKALVTQVSLKRCDTLDENVKTEIEFLLLDEQRIIYVALHEQLLRCTILWQFA